MKTFNRRRFLGGAAGLSAGLFLAACGNDESGSSAGASGPYTAKTFVQNPPSLAQTPYLVAQQMKLFTAASMTMEDVALAPSGMPKALVAGGAQFALTAVASPMLALAKQGIDPICVAKVTTNNPNTIVVSEAYLNKAGVSATAPVADRIAALKGARFGASDPGTGTDVSIQYVMGASNLKAKTDYSITYLHDIGVFLSAMQTGQIDAFAVSSPLGEQAEQKGFGVRYLSLIAGEVPALSGIPWTTMWTQRSVAEKNPELVTAAVSGLKAALTKLNDGTAEAKTALRATFESTADAEFEAAWKNNLPAYDAHPSFDADKFATAIDFYNFGKTGDDVIDVAADKYFTNEYVQAAQ